MHEVILTAGTPGAARQQLNRRGKEEKQNNDELGMAS
jgi:hypothetical protein